VSLLFPYHYQRSNQPLVTLRGRFVRPRPIIPVTIIGPARTLLRVGLLDTGADETIFPDYVAQFIGLDLTNAPSGSSTGVATGAVQVRYAEVRLRIAKANELREWRAWVGFAAAPLRRPLLGFAGFLQYFEASFRGDREEVELKVNALYPGT
jgi:hypothetical protein